MVSKVVRLSKCSTGLSFHQTVLLTPLVNTLVINREMFSGSVDAGFVLGLPFHHGDLEPDCVGVLTVELDQKVYLGGALEGRA